MRAIAGLLLFAASTAYAAVTGTVMGEDGKPIAGATVRAFAAEPSQPYRLRLVRGQFFRQPLSTTTTGADGRFSIEPKALAVDIVADAPGTERSVTRTVDGEDAGVIVLERGGSRLQVTAGGEPVPNAVVVYADHDTTLRTDANGEIEDVTPFHAKLVLHPDYAPAVNGGNSDDVELSKGVPLSGRVVNAAGPVAHAVVLLDYIPIAETAADGTFSVAHTTPDLRKVIAYTANELGSAIRGADGKVEVRIGPALVVKGTARDAVTGAPIAGARMELQAAAVSAGEMVLSDANGNFVFHPVPQGPVSVSGSHPRFTIESTAGSPATVIAARPYARLEGRVVDEKGVAVGGATVFAPGDVRVTTDAAGRFVLRAPDVGKAMSIQAQKQGYALGLAPPRAWHDGDNIRDLAITLPKGFPLQVRVVDSRDRPVPNARVTVIRKDIQMFRYSIGSDQEGCPTCRLTDEKGVVNYRLTEGEYAFAVESGDASRSTKDVGPPIAITARSSPFIIQLPEAPAARRAANENPGRISGRVTDRATHRPLPEFEVQLIADRTLVAWPRQAHGADGSFTLDGLPSGTVGIRIAAPGYTPVMRKEVTIDPGRTTSDVDFELERGSRVAGRVTAKGAPLSRVSVGLDDPPAGTAMVSALTGADGRYQIDGVPPGTRTIVIRREGLAAVRRDIEVKEPEAHLDVELDLGVELRGRVLDARGAGVVGADVIASSSADPNRRGSGQSGIDGWFSIAGLPPSHYTILARKPGTAPAHAEVDVPGAEPLTMTLGNGITITGRVTGVTAQEMASVKVWAGNNESGSVGQVEMTGSFVIEGVPPGKGMLEATVVREGAEKNVTRTVDVRPGIEPQEIDFAAGFVVRGHATINGAPIPFAMANFQLLAAGGGHGAARITNGIYEVSLPKAGDYQVFVAQMGVWGYSFRWTAPASGTGDLDIRGSDLHGRVVDAANGSPIAGAQVRFVGSHPGSYSNTKSGSGGDFVVPAVSDDAGTLLVSRAGYATMRRPVTMAADAAAQIDLRLDQGYEMRFAVVDAADGKPVAGASIEIEAIGESAWSGADGIAKLNLAAGAYKASVLALRAGYEPEAITFNVPAGEVRVAMRKKTR